MTFAPIPDAPLSTLAPPESAATPLAWPPTGRQIAWKPTGGFVLCPTDFLTLPWGLYRAQRLDFFGLRTWLGLLELPERRCDCPPEKDLHYSLEELGRLLDVPRRAPVQTALRTLEKLGLVHWSMSDIRYVPRRAALREDALPGYQAVQAQIPPWRTWVPVPRRILRWLAREGTPGLWATTVGVLLRCLWSKKRHCVSGGRVAASWIAEGFGLAERTVQRALDTLQDIGWLARLPRTDAADAALERRYGARTVVNLAWNVPWADESEDDDNTPAPQPLRREKPRPAGQEVTVEHCVKHGENFQTDQNLSPIADDFHQNLSPTPAVQSSQTTAESSACARASGPDFYPLQEQKPDPLPASRAREDENLPTGGCQPQEAKAKHVDDLALAPLAQDTSPSVSPMPPSLPAAPVAASALPLEDPAAMFAALAPAEQDALLHDATTRLVARGLAATLLIRPVLLAEVYAHLALPSAAVPSSGEDSSQVPLSAAPVEAPEPPAPSVAALAAMEITPPLAVAASCEDGLADPAAIFAALPPAEQDARLAKVTARLLAQNMDKDLLIRPVLLSHVYAELAPQTPAVPAVAPSVVAPPRVEAPASAPAKAPGGLLPPDLRDVVPADLRDVARLDALRQQAMERGWVTGSAADRLNFLAAAVHARRKGDTPCRLFIAIVRARRWELITDGDEDEARALLRQHAGAGARPAPTAARRVLSDDACLVRFVEQTLRQTGSDAEAFRFVASRDATWTRARWEAARAELHGHSGRGLERLGAVRGEEE